MATIKLKGNDVHTIGNLPEVGSKAPAFVLTGIDLSDSNILDIYSGKKIILNVFPSVDTDVCAESVRHFNERAANIENVKVLCISKDLPFAQKNFCGKEGIENVIMYSDFRSNFGQIYGVQLVDGPLKGLLSRCIIIIDEEKNIIHTQQVPEITEEPDYESAFNSI